MSQVPHASVVGIFIYAMVYTKPYIYHAMGTLKRYMSIRRNHITLLQKKFHILCGTLDYEIFYQGSLGPNKVLNAQDFVNVDWVQDIDHQIYTSGYVFTLFGGEIGKT
jgi:hypothetical protein